jgi:hypothetical protein
MQGTFVWSPEVKTYTVRPLPSTTTLPRPETLAMLNFVAGFADELDDAAGLLEPPPQPARIAAAATALAPIKTSFGNSNTKLPSHRI